METFMLNPVLNKIDTMHYCCHSTTHTLTICSAIKCVLENFTLYDQDLFSNDILMVCPTMRFKVRKIAYPRILKVCN